MKIRLAVIAVAAGALVGCGGAKIGSKEEAAGIVFSSGDKGSAAQKQGALARLLQSGADSTGAIVDCTHGGTAEAAINFTGTQDLANLSFTMKFNGCTEPVYDDPETEAVEQEDVTYNGQITLTMDMSGIANGAALKMTYKGRIDLSGAISDYVDADIQYTFTATSTATGGVATYTINGSVKTSSETYTYANETYTLTAEGQVVATPGA